VNGIKTIFKKELADHFSSYRFMILFALIAMVSLITAYMVGLNIKQELEGVTKPRLVFLMLFTARGALFSLVQFVAFFGPLIGLIYRDSVINGKFLAGVVTIGIMMVSIVLVVTGLGLSMVGVVPGIEGIGRILIYLIISIIYISFWLGVSILFSILFRSIATSALAALAVWIFFSFFVALGASVVANAMTPNVNDGSAESVVRHARIQKAVSLASPMQLYTDATATVIDPTRKTTRAIVLMGPMERLSSVRFSGPLPLGQSVLVVLPYIICLVAITAVCFAISYAVFMRQEIRSL
jgi:ABC-2 type transport system permease protein